MKSRKYLFVSADELGAVVKLAISEGFGPSESIWYATPAPRPFRCLITYREYPAGVPMYKSKVSSQWISQEGMAHLRSAGAEIEA